MSSPTHYRGRFAPSPTGELHFGSLVAAVGSWLDARAAGGEWLLRIEDVDTPRTVPGADAAIMRALEAFGLHWDGEVVWQSGRGDAYAAALDRLRRDGAVYACTCSRKTIEQGATRRGSDGAWVYPGTCRQRRGTVDSTPAWRLRVADVEVCFDDRLQGGVGENLNRDVGDFVLRRADGCFTYQLAVVVDDAWQGISDVVRGADLIDSTPRQIWLQRCLGLPTPRYLHLPVATDVAGQKLAKQSLAPALELGRAGEQLAQALAFLGLTPATELCGAAPATLLEWAVDEWSVERLPRLRQRVFGSAVDQ